jgi:hypothetical protein
MRRIKMLKNVFTRYIFNSNRPMPLAILLTHFCLMFSFSAGALAAEVPIDPNLKETRLLNEMRITHEKSERRTILRRRTTEYDPVPQPTYFDDGYRVWLLKDAQFYEAAHSGETAKSWAPGFSRLVSIARELIEGGKLDATSVSKYFDLDNFGDTRVPGFPNFTTAIAAESSVVEAYCSPLRLNSIDKPANRYPHTTYDWRARLLNSFVGDPNLSVLVLPSYVDADDLIEPYHDYFIAPARGFRAMFDDRYIANVSSYFLLLKELKNRKNWRLQIGDKGLFFVELAKRFGTVGGERRIPLRVGAFPTQGVLGAFYDGQYFHYSDGEANWRLYFRIPLPDSGPGKPGDADKKCGELVIERRLIENPNAVASSKDAGLKRKDVLLPLVNAIVKTTSLESLQERVAALGMTMRLSEVPTSRMTNAQYSFNTASRAMYEVSSVCEIDWDFYRKMLETEPIEDRLIRIQLRNDYPSTPCQRAALRKSFLVLPEIDHHPHCLKPSELFASIRKSHDVLTDLINPKTQDRIWVDSSERSRFPQHKNAVLIRVKGWAEPSYPLPPERYWKLGDRNEFPAPSVFISIVDSYHQPIVGEMPWHYLLKSRVNKEHWAMEMRADPRGCIDALYLTQVTKL